MRMIAFITEASTVQWMLNHIGEPTAPPRITPARGPPRWEEEDCATLSLDEGRFRAISLLSRNLRHEFDPRVNC
jgi:hypothetical protein